MKHLLHTIFPILIFMLIINNIKSEIEGDEECKFEDKNLTKENCIGKRNNSYTCCLASGYKLIERLYSCVKLDPYKNNTDGRIAKVDELTNDLTGVYLDCGQQRVLSTNCGNLVDDPKVKDCISFHNATNKCCYMEINFNEDGQNYNLKGCRSFTSININTIGEAVVAAKTRNATLKVECKGLFLKVRMIALALMNLLIIMF